MYTTLEATLIGQFVRQQIAHPSTITRMQQFSNDGHPAIAALTDELPADLSNRYKRLVGHLVRRVMHEHGYALLPGRRCCIPGASLFKTGACYRAVVSPHPQLP
jgi:hypothetical protein